MTRSSFFLQSPAFKAAHPKIRVHSRNRSGKGTPLATIALILVLGVIATVGGLWYMGYLDFGATTEEAPSGDETKPSGGVITGQVNLSVEGVDHFDSATTYTGGTEFNVYWFVNRGGTYQSLGSNAKTVDLTAQDQGTIYAQVRIPSGQNYYVDKELTVSKNPYVVDKDFTDLTSLGTKYWVFQVNLNNLPRPNLGNPSMTFYPYLTAYEAPSLNQPNNITSVATGQTTTQFIQWKASFTNQFKGLAVTQIQITFDTTSLTLIQLNSVYLPSPTGKTGSLIQGTDFGLQRTAPAGTGNTFYTYNIGSTTSLDQVKYLYYGKDQLNEFAFTTQVTTNFAQGTDAVNVTITITGLDTAGVAVTLTDTVKVTAASS